MKHTFRLGWRRIEPIYYGMYYHGAMFTPCLLTGKENEFLAFCQENLFGIHPFGCTYSVISGSGSSRIIGSFRPRSCSSSTRIASCSSELLLSSLHLTCYLLLGGILNSHSNLGGPQFAAIQPSGHSLSSKGQFTSSSPFFT